MNYCKIKWSDISSGPGVRTSIYVSGCTHNCPGCFNPETHDFNAGEPWTKEIEDKIIQHVKDKGLSGLNVLGGDPLQQTEDFTLANFLYRFKQETGKDIWIWTGYQFDSIMKTRSISRSILEKCDVCVDGRFVQQLADAKLRYMGSSNQRVIDVQKSIQEQEIVLYEKSL